MALKQTLVKCDGIILKVRSQITFLICFLSLMITVKPQWGIFIFLSSLFFCLGRVPELSVHPIPPPLFSSIVIRCLPFFLRGGDAPYIGHTGICGLYGWVFSRSKICRYGYILESVSLGLTEFIKNRLKTANYHRELHNLNQILGQSLRNCQKP